MPAFPIPPQPDRLPLDDVDLWAFLCARLEFQNHEVLALESQVKRTGRRMKNRAGGHSTSPEARALAKAQAEQGVIARKLEKLMDRVPPAPEVELTDAQFQLEMITCMTCGPTCPDDLRDELVALAHLAAADPPDADAQAEYDERMAPWREAQAARRAALVLPDLDDVQ